MKIKAYGICVYKKEKQNTKLLFCKSSLSKRRWGFLKGVQEAQESMEQTAIREFKEESSIIVNKNNLKKYFEQQNSQKDIGIFLVDYHDVPYINRYFNGDKLCRKHLSWENSEVQFFSLDNLPMIKKKQTQITLKIVKYLQR